MPRVRLADIAEERQIASTPVPQGETPNEAAQNNAHHVVPVKKLEGISWSEFHGVRPRSPAQHTGDHEDEDCRISFGLVHKAYPGVSFMVFAHDPQHSILAIMKTRTAE